MKNQYLVLLLMPVFMSSGCEKERKIDDDVVCTEQAVSGLNVKVSLQNSTALDPSGITVMAKDGHYTEKLVAYPPHQLYFNGAIERKGNYIITVSKAGYQTFVSDVITVKADSCHVIPQIVNVVLQANGF